MAKPGIYSRVGLMPIPLAAPNRADSRKGRVRRLTTNKVRPAQIAMECWICVWMSLTSIALVVVRNVIASIVSFRANCILL